MSFDQNQEQLFGSVAGMPAELSLKEVEFLFLHPAPPTPARPWWRGGHLKFLLMFIALLTAILTVFTGLPNTSPVLSGFPLVETIPSVTAVIPAPAVSTIAAAPIFATTPVSAPQASELKVAVTPAPPTFTAPAAAPKPNNSIMEKVDRAYPETSASPSLSEAQTNLDERKNREPYPWEETSALEKNQRRVQEVTVAGLKESTSTRVTPENSPRELDVNIVSDQAARPKWGLEQARYMADTLKSCCKMDLTLKGKFRLMLNPNMEKKQMIIYGTPEAIAAMKTKVGYRKMTLRNLLRGQKIDVEINPTAVEGMRLRGNIELVDHE